MNFLQFNLIPKEYVTLRFYCRTQANAYEIQELESLELIHIFIGGKAIVHKIDRGDELTFECGTFGDIVSCDVTPINENQCEITFSPKSKGKHSISRRMEDT